MSVRPYRDIQRRACRKIHVGKVPVGGDAPITVQSMTNTVTSDVKATVEQIQALERAGADIVRVSCPDQESALALKQIVPQVTVPIVADIHFHYRRAIEAAESGAACLRINPGNIGSAERVREVIKAAQGPRLLDADRRQCRLARTRPAGEIRRAVPGGDGRERADHAKILEDNDFFEFKISCKASDVFLAVAAYQGLAEACDYPLHLGITEAGALRMGTVKSSIGLGMLLWAGIGDTIRVSLSADPVEEVKVGYDILKSLGLRRRGVTVISCPSCARQQFPVIKTVEVLEERLGAHHDAADAVGDRLRRQRPGRGARDRYRLHRRRQQHAPGLCQRDRRPPAEGRRYCRSPGRAGRKEGRRDRSGEAGGAGIGRSRELVGGPAATATSRGSAIQASPSSASSLLKTRTSPAIRKRSALIIHGTHAASLTIAIRSSRDASMSRASQPAPG